MTTLADLYSLVSSHQQAGRATQEQLDEIGLLLDRLEVVEAFLDTNCSYQDRRDAEVEFNCLTDRIDLLVENV